MTFGNWYENSRKWENYFKNFTVSARKSENFIQNKNLGQSLPESHANNSKSFLLQFFAKVGKRFCKKIYFCKNY